MVHPLVGEKANTSRRRDLLFERCFLGRQSLQHRQQIGGHPRLGRQYRRERGRHDDEAILVALAVFQPILQNYSFGNADGKIMPAPVASVTRSRNSQFGSWLLGSDGA